MATPVSLTYPEEEILLCNEPLVTVSKAVSGSALFTPKTIAVTATAATTKHTITVMMIRFFVQNLVFAIVLPFVYSIRLLFVCFVSVSDNRFYS